MGKEKWFLHINAVCFFLFVNLLTGLSYGAITANPTTTTFTSPQQSATIKLMNDGIPVSATDIQGWQFLASGHDYKHMLTLEKSDGAVNIAPSKTLEVGSYDLNIQTAYGLVVVQVFAPLSDLPDIVQKTAALTGESEQAIKKKMGLAVEMGRGEINISLPPVYYEGQTLDLSIPVLPGHICTWFINGDLVAEGPEQNSITYTFKKPGEYVLSYFETMMESGRQVIVAKARAHTQAAPLPAIAISANINHEIMFKPPEGYQKRVWFIDGREVSTESTFRHTFNEPGIYTVECLASSPATGSAQGFLRIRYITTVKPQ
ncbi:MAG TPA: hypothetical protein PLI09_19470 [Candidatus Hydrogenedentes bacterium]|nr:hypothetical protein [Candidatus Hydrogenedentota bacterium]